jgi:hypothetical protein
MTATMPPETLPSEQAGLLKDLNRQRIHKDE